MPSSFNDVRELRGEDAVRLRFGGGINSRASEDEIGDVEAADGRNFILDLADRQWRSRPAIDLVDTAPNGGSIDGMAFLKRTDGTVSMLVQAGTTVYEYDGLSTWTSVGTVATGAKLRGRLESNFLLDDKVIITDLALADEIHEWDGTTFQQTTMLDEDGSTAFGPFRAKYCVVSNERAIYANIHDNGTNFPHLIVGSKRSEFEVISVTSRPSSALNDEDPFFLVAPDLRPLNGMVSAFGTLIFSTEGGEIHALSGDSSKDFAVSQFFPRSYADGAESMVNIGNDVLYGRQGRIESVSDTDRFGDSEVNDRSIKIGDEIEDFDDWTLAYNQRLQRAYCFSASESDMWVYFKPIAEATDLSPWVRWTTRSDLAMQPTCVMNGLDPVDGLEYVFMGDSSGRLYRMEGTGTSGDAGANDIRVVRSSKLFTAPLDAHAYNVTGYVKYRLSKSATLKMTFLYQGLQAFNQSIEVSLQPVSNRPVWSGFYWSNGTYWTAPFRGRLVREPFGVAGQGNEIQIVAEIDGVNAFTINEIGLRFETAAA